MVVAVVAGSFTLYSAFRLFFPAVVSSGLTATVFLALAIGLLFLLHEEERHPPEEMSKSGRWASVAGHVLGAFAAGALGAPRARR
jgi:EamA domain-containing membrane protein RarD